MHIRKGVFQIPLQFPRSCALVTTECTLEPVLVASQSACWHCCKFPGFVFVLYQVVCRCELSEVGGVAVGPFETSSGQYIRRVLRTSLGQCGDMEEWWSGSDGRRPVPEVRNHLRCQEPKTGQLVTCWSFVARPVWSYTATASCQLGRGVEADVQVSFGRLLPSEEPLRRHVAGKANCFSFSFRLCCSTLCRPSFVLPSPPWTPSTHVAWHVRVPRASCRS